MGGKNESTIIVSTCYVCLCVHVCNADRRIIIITASAAVVAGSATVVVVIIAVCYSSAFSISIFCFGIFSLSYASCLSFFLLLFCITICRILIIETSFTTIQAFHRSTRAYIQRVYYLCSHWAQKLGSSPSYSICLIKYSATQKKNIMQIIRKGRNFELESRRNFPASTNIG